MAASEEELKSLLMRVKEESEKSGTETTFKNQDDDIRSHHFMANRRGKGGSNDKFSFPWALKSLWTVIAAISICFYMY